MSIDVVSILIIAVVFAATLTRSTFGFGDALVAMPLLALLQVDLRVATPLVALVSMVTSMVIMSRSWQEIDFRAAWRLIVSAVVGLPIGIWLLGSLDERIVKGLLAFIVTGFGLVGVVRPLSRVLHDDRFAYLAGLLAGLLGGAYNAHGPPLVMFGLLRGWPAEKFRATLQGYFLPMSIIVVLAHAMKGWWTPYVLSRFVYCLPFAVAAVFLGGMLNRKLNTRRFGKAINCLLILLGLTLGLSALTRSESFPR